MIYEERLNNNPKSWARPICFRETAMPRRSIINISQTWFSGRDSVSLPIFPFGKPSQRKTRIAIWMTVLEEWETEPDKSQGLTLLTRGSGSVSRCRKFPITPNFNIIFSTTQTVHSQNWMRQNQLLTQLILYLTLKRQAF